MVHYSFTVPGEPRGKARARTVFNGVKAHSFTPKRTREYEDIIRLAHRVQTGQKMPFHGPVVLEIRAFYPIPQSWPKAKIGKALAEMILPTVKPDLDNVIKVMDALNGQAWDDDRQVVEYHAKKRYSAQPRLEIEIWEVKVNEPE